MTAERCPATSKRTGEPCKLRAGYKTDHVGFGLCAFHGGTSPGGRKQAQRLKAAVSASAFGLPIQTTPDEALEAELQRCAGTVAWLAEHLSGVDEEQRLSGQHGAYADLYERERDRLVRVAKAAIDAGIAERQVAAIERSAEAFATALSAILGELGVLDDPRAPAVVQRHLALLDAGGER